MPRWTDDTEAWVRVNQRPRAHGIEVDECYACGETHPLRPTPVFVDGTGAMLCEVCYHLNITLGEGPTRWGRDHA